MFSEVINSTNYIRFVNTKLYSSSNINMSVHAEFVRLICTESADFSLDFETK